MRLVQTRQTLPLLLAAALLFGTPRAVVAQDQTPAPAPSTDAAPVVTTTPADAPATKPVAMPQKPQGKGKQVYTGPTEVVVKAPTPMLDEEGKQRIDPDGKPIFNAPIVQQRDKKGHPLFDEKGNPVFQTATDMGYDAKGKKITIKKEKEPKMTPVSIARGTFTVDGMIGKAELNYEIPDLKFIYLYVPGIGIAIVSNTAFPGSKEEKNAFKANTLTVAVGEHTMQLASDKPLLDKKGKPEPAFVALDRDFTLPSKYPVVGYGKVAKAPYAWPGGKPNTQLAKTVAPPPTPKNLRPVMLLQPCPTGQMRRPAPAVLPGQVAPDQPCVPITKALQDQVAAADSKSGSSAPAPASKP